jgi:hypothetical protein
MALCMPGSHGWFDTSFNGEALCRVPMDGSIRASTVRLSMPGSHGWFDASFNGEALCRVPCVVVRREVLRTAERALSCKARGSVGILVENGKGVII